MFLSIFRVVATLVMVLVGNYLNNTEYAYNVPLFGGKILSEQIIGYKVASKVNVCKPSPCVDVYSFYRTEIIFLFT